MTDAGKHQDFTGRIRELEEQIRALREAEARLREEGDRCRSIIEHQSELICRYRRDGILTFVNEAYCRFFGRSREQLVGLDFRTLIPEEDRRGIDDMMARLDQDHPVFVHEHRVLMPDGRVGWHQWTNTVVLDGSGHVAEYQGVGQDITARREAEDALRLAHEYTNKLIEATNVMVVGLDPRGRVTIFNRAAEEITGYRAEELRHVDWFETVVPRDRYPDVWEVFEKYRKKSVIIPSYSNPILTKSGEERIVSWQNTAISADEEGVSTISFGIDITEQRLAEEALRTSEEKYRSVVDNIGIGVALISPRMEILTLNNQMRKWFPRIDPGGSPICYQAFNDPPRQGICTYCPTIKTLLDGEVHESITETPAGSEFRNYRLVSSPVRDGGGNVIAAIEMVEDITERLRAQEAIRASEAKYRTIFETTGAATMLVEDDMSISMVNTEFEHQSGYSKADVQGKMKWTDFIAEDEEALARMIDYHNLRRVSPEKVPRNYEFRFRAKDGQVRDVFMTVAIIPGTRMSVASLLDITERKKAEAELQARETELEIKSRNLEELNTALKVLLKHREDDKSELEERILSNMKELVLPYLEKLKKTPLRGDQTAFANIIESNLSDIISPFLRKMTSKYLNLTPREIQIATLIREGKTTKEISEVLGVSPRAVEFHRDNIRVKLGIKNKKANLRSFLLSLS